MRNRKNLISIIACVLVALLMIAVIVVSAIRKNNNEASSETTPIEQTTKMPSDLPLEQPDESQTGEESNDPDETDTGISEIDPDEEDKTKKPDVVIDIIEENEKHSKPNNPEVEGDAVVEDGTKEGADEE